MATIIQPRMYHDIQVILSRLVAKAEQLVENVTTNLAESWMHVRAKFDGGKVVQISEWVMRTSLHGGWFATQHGKGIGSHNMERNDEHYPKYVFF